MTTQPQSKSQQDEIDWLVNTIISYPIDGLAMFAANAIQSGTPQSPIPISPSAHKEYKKAHARIKAQVQSYIDKAVVRELENVLAGLPRNSNNEYTLIILDRIKAIKRGDKTHPEVDDIVSDLVSYDSVTNTVIRKSAQETPKGTSNE